MHEIDNQKWYIVNAAVTTLKATKESREHARSATPPDFTMPKAGGAFYMISMQAIKGTMHAMRREFTTSPTAAADRLLALFGDRYPIQDFEPDPFIENTSALRGNKSSEVYFITDVAHRFGYASLEEALTNRRAIAVYDPAKAAALVSKNPGTYIGEFAIDGYNPTVLWPQWRRVLYPYADVEHGEVVAKTTTRFDIHNLFVGTEGRLSGAVFFVPIDGANDDQLMLF